MQKEEPVAYSFDKRYQVYSSGLIFDTNTELEWYVGPDEAINYHDAEKWIQSLTIDSGGWRMPTAEELKGIYEKGKGKYNRDSVFKITGWFAWTGKSQTSLSAWPFDFGLGYEAWDTHNPAYFYPRVVAVRCRLSEQRIISQSST